jgi:hypothetical protein
MICQMIGVFLYCGAATQPLAMFPQSNNLPTAEMAQQLSHTRQYRRDAQPTLFDMCEPGMRMWDATCVAKNPLSRTCFTGCAR